MNIILDEIVDEGDRVLLYPRLSYIGKVLSELNIVPARFHVIAPAGTAATFKVGDVVEYEEGGINFGWYVQGQAEVTQ